MRSRKRYEKWDFLGHSFFTTDLLREPKLTLDIVNLTGLNKDYAILIEGVVNRMRAMGIEIGMMFLDREFFNLVSIFSLSAWALISSWLRRSTSR